ncbi:hypothetical protein ABWED_1427 [Acinetobacter lwoffii]|nr:hypothetical protein ABWED_1427 [Acinetobacter lwoffii]
MATCCSSVEKILKRKVWAKFSFIPDLFNIKDEQMIRSFEIF